MAEAAELGDRRTMETKGGKHDLSDREVAVPLMEKKKSTDITEVLVEINVMKKNKGKG